MHLNEIKLIGFVGQDAELKSLQNSKELVRFDVATKVSWKNRDSGEYDSRTEWHRIVVWGNLTKFAQTVKKGEHVHVSGELPSRPRDNAAPGMRALPQPGNHRGMLGDVVSDVVTVLPVHVVEELIHQNVFASCNGLVVDPLSDGQIEHTEAKWRKDDRLTLIGLAPRFDDFGQSAADEIAVACHFFRQMWRRIGTQHMVDVIHDVA